MAPRIIQRRECRLTPRDDRRAGFTLIELLVVIAIIGVLVAILLPAIQNAREAARRTQCSNQVKQMALATHTYADVNGYFPIGSQGATKHGFFTFILPFIEQQALYDIVIQSASGQGLPERYTSVNTYICPSYPFNKIERGNAIPEENGALSTYQVVAGWIAGKGEKLTASSEGAIPDNGVYGWNFNRRLFEVTDGLSNTFALGEYIHRDFKGGQHALPPGNVRGWIMGDNGNVASYTFRVLELPLNTKCDRTVDNVPFNHLPLGSYHQNGALLAMADASVHFVHNNIDFQTYQALGTCADGESAQLP